MKTWQRFALVGVGVASLVSGLFFLRHRSGGQIVPQPEPGSTEHDNGNEPDAGISLEERTGEARLAYDVKCVDDKGTELPIEKDWRGREFSYHPLSLFSDTTYTCMAANGADDRLLTAKLDYLVGSGRSASHHPYRGYALDETRGEVTFSLHDNGTYQFSFGVGDAGGSGAEDVKKKRTLVFGVGETQSVPQPAPAAVDAGVRPASGYLGTTPIERIGGMGR